jgi:hypothetical protein
LLQVIDFVSGQAYNPAVVVHSHRAKWPVNQWFGVRERKQMQSG